MNSYFEDILLLNVEIFKNTHFNDDYYLTTLERNLGIKFEKIMNKFILDGEIVKEFLINDLIGSILQIKENVIENINNSEAFHITIDDEDFEELKDMVFELVDYHFNKDKITNYYITERRAIEEDFIKVFNNSANLTYNNKSVVNVFYALIIDKLKQLCNQISNRGRNYDLMKFIDVAIMKLHFEKINNLVSDFEETIIDAYIDGDDTIKDLLDERMENLTLTDLNVALASLDNNDDEQVKKNVIAIKDLINIVSVYQSICTNKFTVKIFNFIYSLALIEFKNKIDKTGKYFDYSRVYVNDLLYNTKHMSYSYLEELADYIRIFIEHMKLYNTICEGLQMLYNLFRDNPAANLIQDHIELIYEFLENDLIGNNFYRFSTYSSTTYSLFTNYCELLKDNRTWELKDFIKIYEAKPVMEYQNLTTNLLLDRHDFDFMTRVHLSPTRYEVIFEILFALNVENYQINEKIYKSNSRNTVITLFNTYKIRIDPKLQERFELLLEQFC